MAVNRYLSLNLISGQTQMTVPATTGGSGNAGQIVALNASGAIDATMLPAGVGQTAVTLPTSAALSAGYLVNVYDATNTATARPADCSAVGSEADGFVLAATTAGANATVYGPGEVITGLSGLTPGSPYFLSTVGGITLTPPSTAGNVVQPVGRALSATSLLFNPQPSVLVA